MQRLGRKGYPTYRIVVQDKRRSPNSGKVIEFLGNYNPHTKEVNLKKDLIEKFIQNGAQPSPSVVRLLKKEGVKLPKWVEEIKTHNKKSIKNPTKLRRNQPKEEPKPEERAEEASTEPDQEQTSPEATEEKAEETPAEEPETKEEPAEAEEKPQE